MEVPEISEIIKQFEAKRKSALVDAERYIKECGYIVQSVKQALESQIKQTSPTVFEWLYNCTKLSKDSKQLLHFVLQFIPNLIYLYLYSNANNLIQLKTSTEALLIGIIKEVETKPSFPFHLPSLSRPSIYHQTTSIISPLSLTEAALTRHNQNEIPLTKPTFTGSEVTAINRLLFITTVTMECVNYITLYPEASQKEFCFMSIKLVLSGMHSKCIEEMKDSIFSEECVSMSQLKSLCKEKRFTIDDNFVASLLHGVRLCLCQPCNFIARQALQALKLRAQYEVLTQSIQISSALERLSKEMNPLKLPFDVESHKTYSPRDKTKWPSRTMTVLRTFTGQVLQHNLYPLSVTSPIATGLYDQDRFSNSDAEFYLSESFSKYANQSLEVSDNTVDLNDIELDTSTANTESQTTEISSITSKIADYKVTAV